MGVYGIQGIPGAGKSLYAIDKWIIPALRSKRQVYANIEGLSIDRMCAIYDLDPIATNMCYHNMEPDDIPLCQAFYKDLPHGALVVLDEAQNYFGSRNWESKENKELIPYLTRHRHYGHDVVVITQNIESIDITFRRLLGLTYSIKRAEMLGLKASSIVYIFDRCNVDRAPLGRTWFKYDKNIFRIYSSYVAEDVTEDRKTVNPVLRSPAIWATAFLFFGGIFYLWHSDALDTLMQRKHRKQVEAPVPVAREPLAVAPGGGDVQQVKQDCWVNHTYIDGMHIYKLKTGFISYDTKIPNCDDLNK